MSRQPSWVRASLVMVACGVAVSACSKAPLHDAANQPSPPPGIRYEANISAGGTAPSALELKDPLPRTQANTSSGETLFASMNCDGCHGGGAPGWVGPSLIDGRWRYGGADEEVFSSIFFGRPKGMPAYGGVIGADGVWMLVAYLKAQPVPSVVPTTSYEDMDRAQQVATPVAAMTSAAAASLTARTPDQILAAYGCMACHAVDHKIIGPSLKDVAVKYRGRDAQNAIALKVRNGGSGVWGTVPMPPNPQIPDHDLHTIIQWVLALK